MKNFNLLRATDALCRARDLAIKTDNSFWLEREVEKSRLLFDEVDFKEYDNLVIEVKAGQHEKTKRYSIDNSLFNLLAAKFGTYMASGCEVLDESAHHFLKKHEVQLNAVVHWGCSDYATQTVFLGQAPCLETIKQLLNNR